ncbi:MAG: hypothetical protein O7E56_12040 [SAR324 cluster bacterium]|nr:hypothetical protein [SAR324 cluster bacterium]MCZ6628943.1 hypothetical protein [SAR324 cluster bacterium]MCZ6646977.1 hypothetical protein [SAR324 cluster bacterium]MCZ6841982.1 hypothetical protein [SAR324 cluster bacterium]
MQNRISSFYHAIAAGALGGLLQTTIILIASLLGFFKLLQLPLAFEFNLVWYYQRFVWGAIWGLLFLIPVLRGLPHWKRGLIVGVFPALASLLIFLPFKDGHGYFGWKLGTMMPVVVILFALIWGVIAGSLLDRVAPQEEEVEE